MNPPSASPPRKTHAQALERWNGRYSAPGFLFGESPNAYLASKSWMLPAAGRALILQGYRVEQLGYGTGGPPERDHLYTLAIVRDAFADCEILDLASYDAEINEGTGHKGMPALLGAVVRAPGTRA